MRIGHVWRWAVLAAAAAAVLWLVVPPRVHDVVSPDGRQRWDASDAPPRYQVLWQEARPVEIPQGAEGGRIRPQPGPDGTELYFTLRKTGGDADIFRARLKDGAWQAPEPVAELNTPADDVGPVLLADGRQLWLYSNRPGGHGGFDLYVSDREGDRWSKPRNLGPGINGPANEIEPALSPEGFRLYFSREDQAAADRPASERRYSLWRSDAVEIVEERSWGESRLSKLAAFAARNWWWLLAFALTAALLASLAWYLRQVSLRRLPVPGFFLIALAIHVLLGVGSFYVHFGEGIARQIHREIEEVFAAHLSPQGLHQSHRAGQEAYEKVADLRAVDTVQPAEVPRQVVEMPNVPVRPESPVPEIPLAPSGSPVERMTVAPPEAEPQRAAGRLARRQPRVDWPEEAVPLEQPAAENRPKPKPIEEVPVEVRRRETPPAMASIPPPPVPAEAESAARPTVAMSAKDPLAAPSLPATPLRIDAPRIVARRAPAVADPAEAVETAPLVPAATGGPPRTEEPVQVQVPRRETPAAVAGVPQPPPAPASMTPGAAPPSAALVKEPFPAAPMPEAMVRAAAPRIVVRRRPTAGAAETAEPAPLVPNAGEGPPRRPPEPLPVHVAKGETPHVAVSLPKPADARRPAKLGGLYDPRRSDLVVGSLERQEVEAPLSFSPLATRIVRRPARAPDLLYAEDAIGLQAMYRLRQGEMKRDAVTSLGGSDQSLDAVRRGLEWLARHQHADGHWSLHEFYNKLPGKTYGGQGWVRSDSAATGFALLPFLGDGNTHQSGPHQAVVRRGVEWLVGRQGKQGELSVGESGNPRMYAHAIATIALCEACGMTRDPKLQGPARRAVEFILAGQHLSSGGWRYQPNMAADTSVVGWQVMALKSGQMAGLSVPQERLELVKKWLDSVEGKGTSAGQFSYQKDRGPTPAMTAEALLCLQYLGARRDDARVQAGAKHLLQHLPKKGAESSYYWYYGTQVMYHLQGEPWERWNAAMRDLLVGTQLKEGHLAGTWDPKDQWESQAGRLYATALRLLMLEVYYRHLPLYQVLEP